MKNRILVTGSSGNIGTQIVKQLETSQANFLIGVSSNKEDLSSNQVHVDFNDKASLVKAFKDIDTLFLLFPMIEPMIDFAKNAIEAAKEVGVKHIVRSSGAGADSSSTFKMPKVQGTIDDLVKQSGMNYTITKPTSFMQNFVNFFANDIKNGTLYMPAGQGKLGWVDVRDIAAVNAEILKNPNAYVNQELTITGAENLSFEDALSIVSSVLDKKVNYVDVPENAAIQAMKDYGMPDFVIEMTRSLNQIIKAGYAEGVTETVEKITGKQPISFRQFVEDYKENWQ
ncbi:SDR family oxidoreductase [Polaribacter porphyrae]|uniref:NmrA-like domain-containing protein n=1 Tax=Polaribacter porphyrae TaxID=1137780 RepID=A0A2S7WNV3_9FLAO|nr:SDR family oxidoreductase [Polaribacter porphyrae]PQJ78992.1 hypothetical protein BTO18_07305 [Polaribacter porphyrae]